MSAYECDNASLSENPDNIMNRKGKKEEKERRGEKRKKEEKKKKVGGTAISRFENALAYLSNLLKCLTCPLCCTTGATVLASLSDCENMSALIKLSPNSTSLMNFIFE